MTYDFSGWATKNDLLCSDGRIIRKDAFKHCDGMTVPMVWNHVHNTPNEILGKATLQNMENGVRAYCVFNDSEAANNARIGIMHGDITSLSIYANHLKQNGNNVLHGDIKEVSLVLAGANPGAMIDDIITHSDGDESGAIIYTDEELELYHSDDNKKPEEEPKKEDNKMADEKKTENKEQTVEDVLDTLNETQKKVVYALLAQALEERKSGSDENKNSDKKGDDDVKHNAFDTETDKNTGIYISHSDEATILANAKQASCGSFREAFQSYMEAAGTEENALQHGFESIGELFPEYKDIKPGEPELLTNDQSWVSVVMNRVSKSPISRVRTRQADIRNISDIRGRGYVKGAKKSDMGNIKLVKRTTDPQTIYVKDYLNRDDVIDITDFSVVSYLEKVMRIALNEEIATAILIGDGRDEGDADKISDAHIRPIWTDDNLYTIHTDVDIAAAKKELQGTNTSANFSENYIYAEAIIAAALYSREKYKGSGDLTFFCTPHLLNVMLLARDLNGRRIYDSKADLAAALNVTSIQTVEQFEGKTRTVDGSSKKLLGIFVNLSDYQVGSTKGGEISKFEDFDINFNQEIKLIETRLSGALTRVYSAIVLEEPTSTTNPETA
jgi:hypothetical protein